MAVTSEGITPSGSSSIRFYLDGNVKTVNRPVTGAALHVVAGSPASLTAEGGGEVPNSFEPFELKEDQKLTSTPAVPGKEVPLVQPTKAELHEKREAILDEVAAGHGGPYGKTNAQMHEEALKGPAGATGHESAVERPAGGVEHPAHGLREDTLGPAPHQGGKKGKE
jgi:hypothetical protein